ncbi:CMRF35-like molecule 3 isoform X1 [Tachysurus fulvidraco]|uniref:CMRF35-like molecule 3 isoform X1 n=1 Tax=Tachysurus fulvidraco TaxID=1234273 RepID=UPI001FF02742|nr:CMRF35-like molecule 3 isoform X1 [Tachysurus fulvidraco]
MFYQSGRPATSSLFFLLINTKSGTDAVTIVTGYRGRSVQIKCPYKSGYEDYNKYLCRGECSIPGFKDIPVESGSPAKDPRFSLYDNKTARVFTVTITGLRPEDKNTYWCAIERTLADIYTEFLLQVKTVDPTISSVSHTTHFTPTHGDTTHSVTDKLLTYTTHKTTITPPSQGFTTIPLVTTVVPVALVLLLFGLLSAGVIWWEKKTQGSGTVTQSSRQTNEDYANDQNLHPVQARVKVSLPESDYKGLNPTTSQSASVYQTLSRTNNQSDSVYQTLSSTNNQSDSVYQTLSSTNNQSDSVYQTLSSTNNQSDSVYQTLSNTNNQSDSVYKSCSHINKH